MNYTEAIQFIHSIPKFRRPLGNANLAALLESLGNPHKKLRFIHIAGTNGKGSTAAMTAEILKRDGYKTGLFTSPFLEVFNDRIRINGDNIHSKDLALYTERVKKIMEKNDAPVSEFAFITAVSFLYFYEKKCEFVVLEVGMGGNLDATNIIPQSLVSVICKIGIDHTQYLGNTIEEITLEKCGIIKENGIVVSYPNYGVADIIRRCAKEKSARVVFAEKAEKTEHGFIYKGNEYPLSLKGLYQPQNAAVTLEIINALRDGGIKITEKAVIEGLNNTVWAARFEFIKNNVIIDGGHNIDGIKALKKSLLALNKDIILVMAMMKDKDYTSCIREIAPIAKTVIATEINIPRCLESAEISKIVKSMNIPVIVNNNLREALFKALDIANDAVICVCGSLFLAGEIRKIFHKKQK